MGITVEVNSLEEMCSMMCDNKIPTSNQWWIFTFGCGHAHPGKYVKIRGTFKQARRKMFEKYGGGWAFQYTEKQWEEMKADPNRCWPMETELEVI